MPAPIVTALLPYVWKWLTTKTPPIKGKRKAARSPLAVAFSPRLLMLVALFAGGVWFGGGDRVKNQIKGWLRTHVPALEAITEAQGGAIRVYFTNPAGDPNDPNNIAHAVVKYIDETKTSIDVAAFELDNKIIVDALVRAVNRGVKVRLVTDSDYIKEHGPEALRAVGVPIVEDRREALMHNKFMVFDGTAVWTGSMNFTENCAYKNDNHGIYFAVPELAENYATKFRWMFEEKVFGRLPHAGAKIPHPVIKLKDGTVIENYFSTHDQVAAKVVTAINTAEKTLDFMAFSFTHDGIGKAIEEKVREGVVVRGVFEKSQSSPPYSEYGHFKSLGLPVFTDANPRNLHHKAMIIDLKTTIGGSFNFSKNANQSNDENLVIISNNPDIAKKFETEFLRVFELARNGAK